MKVKYLEERTRANGHKVFVVNPPKYVRDAIGASYEQYESRSEAVDRATLLAEAYKDYRRGIKRNIHIPQDTVDGLVAFYKTTAAYQSISENSKIFYQLMIRTASNTRIGSANITFGEMTARSVDPTHSDKIYSQLKLSHSEHRAVHVCKIMRKIWYVCKRHGKVQSNPFERMGIKELESRKVLWEPEQVDGLIRKSDEIGMDSIGTLALLCYDLCQRPGDMRQIKWSSFDGQSFRFNQEKTGTEVEIPASPRLIERLQPSYIAWRESGAAPDASVVVCERTGRPYDRFLYVKDARRVRDAAGLPTHLQIRDLRRTGATEMAEAGCTEDELRSVTGHQSRDVLSIYVRPTKKLAAAGVNKRFNKGL